jgi:L-cysteine:1D-myo-inositol 2-amino-2-deoxy-alpha-D-glucopyranoside ligase
MHVGLVGLDGTKMSKSLGNLVFVGDLAKEADAAAVRLALLMHHYRHDWEWRHDDLTSAVSRLSTWRSSQSFTRTNDALDEVRAHLDNDLDTVSAVRAIDDAAQSGYNVTTAAALLGITL